MIHNHTVSLVIPCRNEGGHLAKVIKRIPSTIDEIIIVNNQSTDNTALVARQLTKTDHRIKVLTDSRTIHGIGYGYAHITGLQHAKGDILVGIDGDGTYPPEVIPALIKHLLTHQLDFVSANRYPLRPGATAPKLLQFGTTLLNQEIRLLYGFTIKDSLSGMWAFRSSILPKLALSEGGWNFSPQIKLNAWKQPSVQSGEYPITQGYRFGRTKQHYVKTGLSHILWIARSRFL